MLRRTWLEGALSWLRPALLSAEDEAFLHDQARRLAAAARLGPNQEPNQTPYAIRVPGGNMGYPAFWIRDAVMMLGADLVPADELAGWIRLICSTIPGPSHWAVRPGAVVPPYAIADHINFDGRPTFYPGTYDSGTRQGGPPYGKYPPIDDYFYFLHAVWEHSKLAGDTSLFEARVKTAWTEMPLWQLCERVYAVPLSDAATGLCVSSDIQTENAKDFGFCDTVNKSGLLLFPSLLKFVAARQLAGLFRAIGQPDKARQFDADAHRIGRAIGRTFLHDGWLHSATAVGNQPDIWGTAYAVWCGAVAGKLADSLGRSLARAYRDKSAVREGCVRHTFGNWESTGSKPGEYQNGGYWGTPVGWYLTALERADGAAARAMAADYIGFLRSHLRPDGTAEAWEWFNPDSGRRVNPLYAATVVLPWISLRAQRASS
jgi:hypothetical protein